MIDASHDNSGKDPEKQMLAAAEIADQIAAGNEAIVGVMLESFLVEGRQDLGDGDVAHLRPVDHRRLHRLGAHRDGARGAGGGGAGAARPMRVAVLGVGLIGGSIGLAARQRLGRRGGRLRPEPADRRSRRSSWARSTAAPARSPRPARAPRSSSAPRRSRRCPSWPARRSTRAGPRRVVTDVGSTKREIVAALGEDERFIGGHPLAGAETAGVENARADLFEGARWYLTPTERTGGVLYDRLQRTIAGLGARPQAIDAEAHDRLMATVSHLPHVLANVLVDQAAAELTRDSERLPEVGPSFRDTTRVAGSNPAIWGDIFATNREAVAEAIDDAVARLRRGARADPRRATASAVAAWHAARGEDRRRLLEAELAGGAAARAARRRRQPARDGRRAGPGAGRGRGQHRGHGAATRRPT